MLKKIVFKVFYSYYDLTLDKHHSTSNKTYNSYGMVIPKKEKSFYYGSPVIANKECINASRKKYGFQEGDNVDRVFKNIYDYYEKKTNK